MSGPFYAKSPENQGYIKNMEVVGFCDLNGVNAFQMALHVLDIALVLRALGVKGN